MMKQDMPDMHDKKENYLPHSDFDVGNWNSKDCIDQRDMKKRLLNRSRFNAKKIIMLIMYIPLIMFSRRLPHRS